MLLFPSTIKQLPTLPYAARAAIDSATVPISLQVDHAQDEAVIRELAEMKVFDSIMVDMSHHDFEQNIATTRELAKLCHSRGIAIEGEIGRINGGEDGISDTAGLEGEDPPRRVALTGRIFISLALLTGPAEVEDFLGAAIDILAPSIGNIHGDYGSRGPQLDFARLNRVSHQVDGKAYVALHGTNDFTPDILRQCIEAGAAKLNVNKLLLGSWADHLAQNAHKPLMQLMDEGMEILSEETSRWMDICGSSGKADHRT